MKILLLGDASSYHHSLSVGLAKMGHQVTVASNGSRWMDTARNIDISRRNGKLGGAILWLKLKNLLRTDLKDYDVVQISNPVFVDLRPQRVRGIFDELKRRNGSVFLTALGTDKAYIDMCVKNAASPAEAELKYTEWFVDNKPTPHCLGNRRVLDAWQTYPLKEHCEYICDNVEGVIAALYEYYLAYRQILPPDVLAYGGIAVDADASAAAPMLASDGVVRIMAACHKGREKEKGIDVMMKCLEDFTARNAGRVQLDFVQNVPFQQFKAILDRADIVVDQLYAYSPSTTPLMAMAKGRVAVTGGEEGFYDFIGEKELRPIINPDPRNIDALAADLQRCVDDIDRLRDMGRQGVQFVAKHNSYDVVAKRFVDFWERRMR